MDNSNKVLEHQEVTNLKIILLIYLEDQNMVTSLQVSCYLFHKKVLIKKTVLSSWYEKLMPLRHILAAKFWFKL